MAANKPVEKRDHETAEQMQKCMNNGAYDYVSRVVGRAIAAQKKSKVCFYDEPVTVTGQEGRSLFWWKVQRAGSYTDKDGKVQTVATNNVAIDLSHAAYNRYGAKGKFRLDPESAKVLTAVASRGTLVTLMDAVEEYRADHYGAQNFGSDEEATSGEGFSL